MLPAAVHTHRAAHMDAEEADEWRRRILARPMGRSVAATSSVGFLAILVFFQRR
jgi:hypothetical protein